MLSHGSFSAMYLLIFPEFPGCAFSSISVQIHTGAFLPFFVRNRQISALVCLLVPSIYYKFPRLTANSFLYIFTCQFFVIWQNPLCSFRKLFRNNSAFFVYLSQNMNVQNFCEVGHDRLLCPGGTTFCTFIFTAYARYELLQASDCSCFRRFISFLSNVLISYPLIAWYAHRTQSTKSRLVSPYILNAA